MSSVVSWIKGTLLVIVVDTLSCLTRLACQDIDLGIKK